jgi:Spy/CpxP family protein refolding chaperone
MGIANSHFLSSGIFAFLFGSTFMMSIRFLRQAVAFSLMTLLVSAFASAQPPGGGGRGGFGGFGGGGGGRGFTMDRAMLLRNEQVRKELTIEEAQAATIDAALEAYREERSAAPRPDRDAIGKMSEEERTALFDKMRKEGEELSKKTDEVLSALLETEQTKRLDQISFQLKLQGSTLDTLKSDELKTKLSLTEEQIAKLDDIQKSVDAEREKARAEREAGGGGGRPQGGGFSPGGAGFEQMIAARKKTTDDAMAVLTADQTKIIDEMTGAKFELDMRAMFGGGRPGGGGQDGGGGRQRNGGGGNRPPAE